MRRLFRLYTTKKPKNRFIEGMSLNSYVFKGIVEFSNLFETELAKIDGLFRTKMAELENYTIWGRTYLYSSSKGVPS